MPFKALRRASSRGSTGPTRTWSGCRSRAYTSCSQRFHVLHEISHLRVGQPQIERLVVMLHDRQQRRVPAVVIEAAALTGPDAPQGRRPIAMIRRPVGLEII